MKPLATLLSLLVACLFYSVLASADAPPPDYPEPEDDPVPAAELAYPLPEPLDLEGAYVSVTADGRSVELLATQTKAGVKARIEVDVLGTCGDPEVGGASIRELSAEGKTLTVVYGKHSFATINVESGELTCGGAD